MSSESDNGFSAWGGYMNAKISKLEQQFDEESAPFRKTNLFSGISVFVNGLTNPSADEIKRIMMVNGGIYHHYKRSHTTFEIASNLPHVKINNMDTSKIISAQWIIDCLREQRIVDYTNYLLYTNHNSKQPKIKFPKLRLSQQRHQQQQQQQQKQNESSKIKLTETYDPGPPDPEIVNIEKCLNILNQKICKLPINNLKRQEKEKVKNLQNSPDLFLDDVDDDDVVYVGEISDGNQREKIKDSDGKKVNINKNNMEINEFDDDNDVQFIEQVNEDIQAPKKVSSGDKQKENVKDFCVKKLGIDENDVEMLELDDDVQFLGVVSNEKQNVNNDDNVQVPEEEIDDEKVDISPTVSTRRNRIIRRPSTSTPKLQTPKKPKTTNTTIEKTTTTPNTTVVTNTTVSSTTHPGPARTAVDPQFLSEFYNNSRLHHIATLGAGFKQYISELRENHSGEFPKRQILREKLNCNSEFFTPMETTIMHIDMDCFFVSVGLRSHPELRGQPIAVTHSKGSAGESKTERPGVNRQLEMDLYMKRLQEKFHDNVVINGGKADKIRKGFDGHESLSEIASCSYEARKMGVKNGMFVGQALKLCPQLKTIPYDFEGYKEVAYTLYNTITQYTLNIEAVSCDEMFVDLTELLNDIQCDAMKFVEFIRNEVKNKTSCPCSAGIGGNRLQARMATKKAKPDGQFYLYPENVEDYMKNIPISDLPGVGYSTTQSLNQMKCKTCGDLQKIPLSKLQNEIGKKFGETLYQFCRGIDNRPLTYGQIRKSVSAEVNYGIRFTEYSELEKFLHQLCTEIHLRLQKIKRKGKCITLKVMIRSKDAPIETAKFMGHGLCDYLNKSISLHDYTDNLEIITKNVLSLMKSLNIPPKELRGIGIQITKLNIPDTKQEIESINKKDNGIKALFNKVIEKKNNTKPLEKTSTVEVPTTSIIPTIVEPVINNKPKPETQITKTNSSPKKVPKSPNKPKSGLSKKAIGRPPKTKQNGKIPKNCNIMNMFQSVATKRSHPSTDEDIDSDIDREVLAELPEDIRKEVIRDYAKMRKLNNNKTKQPPQPQSSSTITTEVTAKTTTINNNNNNNLSPSKGKIRIDAEFLDILPSQLRKEVQQQISLQDDKIVIIRNDTEISEISSNDNNEKSKNNNNNIFTIEKYENLIKAWINSADKPEDFDVKMLINHACELIELKNIFDLYDPLIFLKKLINETKLCSWHKTYKIIIERIQEKMTSVYGADLLLDDKLDCDKCNL